MANFNSYERNREPRKKRTTKGFGLLPGVAFLVPRRFVAHARMLSCWHADRLPRGHAAVLGSLCLSAGAFPLGVHLLSRVEPVDCAWWRHAFTLPCCDLDSSRRTTRGQQEDKKRATRAEEDNRKKDRGQKMTTEGHGFGDWLAAAAKLVSEDKKRTTRGQEEGNSQQEENAQTLRSPARPKTLTSLLFSD